MKFGLIEKKPPKQVKLEAAPSIKVASIFDEDEEQIEEENKLEKKVHVSTSISSSDQYVSKLHEEALKEDANIFDYDGSINDYRKAKTTPLALSSAPKESQYMKNLLAKAEERKIETELIKLRNMKRQAGPQQDEEEVFVTAAYTERLKELEAKERELLQKQSNEDDGDVTKRKDMSGFYFNLMKRNVSFGAERKLSTKDQIEEVTNKESVNDEVKSEINEESEEEAELVSFGPKRPVSKR